MQRKVSNFIPLIVLAISFLIVLFSIYKIINMVKPVKSINSNLIETIRSINDDIYSSSQLNYKALEAIQKKIPMGIKEQFSSRKNAKQIAQLSPKEQNLLVRNELIDFKLRLISLKLEKMYESQQPLIFRFWFWVYSFLIWAFSIIGSVILKFWTNELIEKYWK